MRKVHAGVFVLIFSLISIIAYAETIYVDIGRGRGSGAMRIENAEDKGAFYEAEHGGKMVRIDKKSVFRVEKDRAPIVIEKYPDARFPINYAIIVSKKTKQDENWGKVVKALQKKYKAGIFEYEGGTPAAVMTELINYSPKYVCFVAHPMDVNNNFVKTTIEMMRKIDADPYYDAIWAIMTGYDHNDALRMIKADKLILKNALSHVGGGWLDFFNTGVSFSECEAQAMFVKEPGKNVEKKKCEQDTIKKLIEHINSGNYHIFSTSGHATENDWQAGYSYKNGYVRSEKGGRIFGVDLSGNKFEIKSDNSKIYYSPGNCLIAHILHKDCMALSWIHSGGANQFFGHIEFQYRTCRAWGIIDYFFVLQDRHTFAESFYLNNQSTIYALENQKLDAEKKSFFNRCMNITILYGDPAWEARLARECQPAYDQELKFEKTKKNRVTIKFTIKANQDCGFGRPAIAILQNNITNWKIVSSDAGNVVVLNETIIMSPLKEGETILKKDEKRTVVIEAELAPVLKKKPKRSEDKPAKK